MWWLDQLALELLAPLAVWVFANGLDDAFLDLCYLTLRFRARRRVFSSPFRSVDGRAPRIAVLVPCWREADVIEAMLERNRAAIDYPSYDIWVGLYPNDPACIEKVRRCAARLGRIRPVIGPRDGPTTKADCLNGIFEAIFEHERRGGPRYDLFLQHDAEDIIDPRSLGEIARLSARYDMIQVPVFALPTPLSNLTHGVYCDEFAESHQRDLPVRAWMGGFIPSAGVGTALSRNAVDQLQIVAGDRVFDPDSLTEDYFLGLQVKLLGFPQTFLPPADGPHAVATRAFFPRTFGAAVRQRTRWIIGNHLQAWERFGWRAGARQFYWLWRDRKSLLNHPLSALATLLFLYGLARVAWAGAGGHAWAIGSAIAARPWLSFVLLANLVLLAWRLTARGWLSGRLYGARHGWATPLRAVWANALNVAATMRALWIYARARRLKRSLVWSKTAHHFPVADAARASGD